MNVAYPRIEHSHKDGTYTIGDASETASMSWALASAYLIVSPLGDEVPRFVQQGELVSSNPGMLTKTVTRLGCNSGGCCAAAASNVSQREAAG